MDFLVAHGRFSLKDDIVIYYKTPGPDIAVDR